LLIVKNEAGDERMNIERLGMLLHKTDIAFKRELDAELAKLKLTHIELGILMDLYQQKVIGSDQSRTISIIAARLGQDTKELEKIIINMEKNDWVVRMHDQIDRRRVDVFLSSKARSVIDFLREIYGYVDDRAYKGFSKEEIEQTEAYLKRIADNLKQG
jgi:DNA-binding MarR family transcriptional regulator